MNPRAWAVLVVGALVLTFAAGIVLLGVQRALEAADPTSGLIVALVGFAVLAVGAVLVAVAIRE